MDELFDYNDVDQRGDYTLSYTGCTLRVTIDDKYTEGSYVRNILIDFIDMTMLINAVDLYELKVTVGAKYNIS